MIYPTHVGGWAGPAVDIESADVRFEGQADLEDFEVKDLRRVDVPQALQLLERFVGEWDSEGYATDIRDFLKGLD